MTTLEKIKLSVLEPKRLDFDNLVTPENSIRKKALAERRASFQATGDDLVSVTVRKNAKSQKAGIKIVQQVDGVYITAITEDGLLDNTQIEVGDKLLSINGKRLPRGESAIEFMKLISSSRDKVTLVVKKRTDESHGRKATKKKPVKRIVEKQKFRKGDGSFDYSVNPSLESYQKAININDNKEQERIKAIKDFPQQGGGLMLKKKGDMLFVSGIALDSIFKDTKLAVGDRVVEVMSVNFMTYADAKYAATLLKRAKGGVADIVIERGWDLFDKEKDVDPAHDEPEKDLSSPTPSQETQSNKKEIKNGKKNDTNSVVIHILDKLEAEKQSMAERQTLRKNQRPKRKDKGKKSISESPTKKSSSSSSKASKSSFSAGVRLHQIIGDFVCVSIKKNSEIDTGIKLKKREGKFILSKLPEHEKRIPVGTQVFAINGVSEFQSISKAKDLISQTKEHVVLFINFDGLVAFRESDLVPSN